MALTPVDIHNKEFRRSFRGYSETEVDDFLDEIGRDFEALLKERDALRDQLRDASAELARYRNLEDSMNRALVAAQEAAERTIAAAEKQAELIVREAEDRAREIEKQAEARAAQVQARWQEIIRETEAFKLRMRSLLLAQLDIYQPGFGEGAAEAAATATPVAEGSHDDESTGH